MPKPVLMFATLCGLAACAADAGAPAGTEDRKRRDAGAQTVDASTTTTADASMTSGGTISCYTEGAPSNTCTLPIHCCFTNYSAQHDGYCTTDSCAWGTIDCDGPEDCAGGQHCCSNAIVDGSGVTIGYSIACQSNACGSPPLGEELCHPDGSACASAGSCVTAYGNNNDLPRTLYICR